MVPSSFVIAVDAEDAQVEGDAEERSSDVAGCSDSEVFTSV